jgi:hypothetical protein
MESVKICSKCKQPKEINNYRKEKASKDGYSCWCKQCFKNYTSSLNYIVSVAYQECSKCKILKDSSNFPKNRRKKNGLNSICKECSKPYFDKYNKSEKYKNYRKSDHFREIKKASNHRLRENGSTIRYEKSERGIELRKLRDKKRCAYKSVYLKNKRNNEPSFKIADNCRRAINIYMKKSHKINPYNKLLGCDYITLTQYIESKFQEGMTWENYGRGADHWTFDHYIPCSYFDLTIEENKLICFNYLNVQPLLESHNCSKNKSIPHDALQRIEQIKLSLTQNKVA